MQTMPIDGFCPTLLVTAMAIDGLHPNLLMNTMPIDVFCPTLLLTTKYVDRLDAGSIESVESYR